MRQQPAAHSVAVCAFRVACADSRPLQQRLTRSLRPPAGVLSDKVKTHMTSPAITINLRASVQEAGDLMIRHHIRRLPVVSDEGAPGARLSHPALPCAGLAMDRATSIFAAGVPAAC